MKRSRHPKLISRACLFAAAALLTVGAPPTARAANIFFDQNGATAGTGATGAAAWDTTSAFWINAGTGTTIGGTTAGTAYTFTSADTAYFTGGVAATITLGTGVTLNGINDATGMTFAGNTFTFAGTTPTITTATGKTTTISSVVAGTAGLTKAGAGALVLSGTNTYSGTTTLSAGTLRVGSAAALGTSTLSVTGGSLDAASALTITNAISLAGNLDFTGTANLTQTTGAVTLTAARTITANANTLSLGGIVGGAFALTKAGAGTLTLAGANTYSGGTVMTAGKLSVGSDGNLGATAGGLTFNAGTLLSTGTFSSARAVTMTGAGTIEVAASQTLTMTGAFTGTGTLTKTGTGKLVLNTNAKVTGANTVSAGVLSLGFGGGAGTIRGTVTVASGAQLESTANDAAGYTAGTKLDVVNLTGNGTLAALTHTTGNFGWGTTFNLTGAIMQTNGGTNLAAATSMFSQGNNSKVVTVASATESKILGRLQLRESNTNNRAIFDVADGAAAVDLRVGAFVTESAAGFGIEKTGVGLMLLEQDNTYSGETHILGGRLQIAGDLKLGTAPTAASATKITFNNGGLLNTTATMTLNTNRGVTLTGNGGFDVNSGTTLSYAGIIAGAGVLQKTGAGTLIITGTNTFTGGVNLIGGSLQIDNANRFGTNGAMNFNNGAKLITTANITLAGAHV